MKLLLAQTGKTKIQRATLILRTSICEPKLVNVSHLYRKIVFFNFYIFTFYTVQFHSLLLQIHRKSVSIKKYLKELCVVIKKDLNNQGRLKYLGSLQITFLPFSNEVLKVLLLNICIDELSFPPSSSPSQPFSIPFSHHPGFHDITYFERFLQILATSSSLCFIFSSSMYIQA
jgi:hypothetical protein